MNRLYTGFHHNLIRAIGVERTHLHAEAFCNPRNIAAHLAESMDAEAFSFKLAA